MGLSFLMTDQSENSFLSNHSCINQIQIDDSISATILFFKSPQLISSFLVLMTVMNAEDCCAITNKLATASLTKIFAATGKSLASSRLIKGFIIGFKNLLVNAEL
jgi:hypothetical protein